MTTEITTILLLALQGILIIVISPLLIGFLQVFKCWLQNRTASSLFQPYFVFYKLLIKEPILPYNASWLFKYTPFIYFCALSILAFSTPFIFYRGLFTSIIDVIVLVGILALARISMILAAMDIGSAFGSLGARREMFIACLVEPILLLVLLNLGLITHGLTLGHISFSLIQHSMLYPSLAFSLCAFTIILLAENSRFPFDNPSTHLELTMIHEAMVLEYSGRYLAAIEWSNALKLELFLLIFINLFFPFGLAVETSLLSITVGFITTLVKLIILLALLAITETLQTKVRIFRIPEYLGLALFLAFLGILLTQLIGTTA
ncbi:respiratory chain complex I subunit 1 family protein [Fastidiosibacter lacustris]|uniref:respiratory chain complex I subunit 1 family protein n=1 Tax=Fastidiosibacter lacustris TaxID=2056695 RepID=UPI0013005290|nr:NADH-quinone oxidoreductase subunit H [Fastidiosibacter lacustris]